MGIFRNESQRSTAKFSLKKEKLEDTGNRRGEYQGKTISTMSRHRKVKVTVVKVMSLEHI